MRPKKKDPQAEEIDLIEPISKTKLKAEADALQDIGVKLVALPNSRLSQLDLPERLFDAIAEAKRITANGATRRQKQYIGSALWRKQFSVEVMGVAVAPRQTWAKFACDAGTNPIW